MIRHIRRACHHWWLYWCEWSSIRFADPEAARAAHVQRIQWERREVRTVRRRRYVL